MNARRPIRIRASSFSTLFDCPSRWIAINIEGLKVPSRANSVIGTATHAGTANFDRERLVGQVPSVAAAQDAAVESVRNPNGEVDWDDSSPAEAATIAASLTQRYCTLESPKHEFVAVEATIEALEITDLGIVLTGSTDRVKLHANGGKGIGDIKTGKTAVAADGHVETKGHSAQMGVYELIAGAALGEPMTEPAVIIGLQANKTPDKQRIGTGEIVGAREVLLGDDDNPGLLKLASRIVHGDIPAWGNPKSIMCSSRYCPRYSACWFRR